MNDLNLCQCGSDRVDRDRIIFEGKHGAEVVVPMECAKCGCYWKAVFVFSKRRDERNCKGDVLDRE